MAISAQHRQKITERRRAVAALRLKGVRKQAEVAVLLGVSVGTINADFKALDADFQERAAADIRVEKGIDLARIEAMIASLWDRALDPACKSQTWLIDRVLSLLQHKAKLLGLEAPAKIDVEHRVRALAAELGLDEDEAVAVADAYVRSLKVR